MPLKAIKRLLITGWCMLLYTNLYAQQDTLYLSLQQLFERGTEQHLQLAADRLKEKIAHERTKTARTTRLPELNIGLKGGFLGQPVIWQNGMSNPTYPDSPDWQQNYTIDFTQPIYQGGKIRYSIRQADLEEEIARLQTTTDQADIKLVLLEQYLNLFSLYKQYLVLNRKINESERRLKDIRQMKAEGIITNNDVLRSEMQLTNDRLSKNETENNIRIVSQQLNLLIGLDEHLLLIPDTTLLSQECPTTEYEDYVNRAFLSDPALLLLRKQTELAENNIRLTRAEQLPRLSLTASNTLARPVSRTLTDMYNNSWNIGLSFSYPPFIALQEPAQDERSPTECAADAKRRRTEATAYPHECTGSPAEASRSNRPRGSFETIGETGGRELPNHAEPVYEPTGHSDGPARCRQPAAECRTATDHCPYSSNLHLLRITTSHRSLINRIRQIPTLTTLFPLCPNTN